MASNPTKPASNRPQRRVTVGQILSMPPTLLSKYDDFITKNAGQVSQIESALRSLTYIIPGWWSYFSLDLSRYVYIYIYHDIQKEHELTVWNFKHARPLSRC